MVTALAFVADRQLVNKQALMVLTLLASDLVIALGVGTVTSEHFAQHFPKALVEGTADVILRLMCWALHYKHNRLTAHLSF